MKPEEVEVGQYVVHILKGKGVVLSAPFGPFAAAWVERWDGRGSPPTVSRGNGFWTNANGLKRAALPVRVVIRRTRTI